MPNTAADPARLSVAVGVIRDAKGRVLVSRRSADRHQGGCWEFPGGKVDAGESVDAALARELDEELGITVSATEPLIDIAHDYPERQVWLQVRNVDWHGTPSGREGQPLRWVAPEALDPDDFPRANRPIIAALRLPPEYVISPDSEAPAPWLAALDRTLAAGAQLIGFRVRLTGAPRRALAREALARCRAAGASLMISGSAAEVRDLGAAGLHMTAGQLAACTARPLPDSYWLAASCHGPESLRQAAACGADFAVLSPVQTTTSHPGATPLGWPTFAHWTARASVPVYALGGLQAGDRATARRHGGQGVAGITGLWDQRVASSSSSSGSAGSPGI
jgi:8-oxo-dGTP diphosphatase